MGFHQFESFFYRSFPEFDNAEILSSNYGWLLMSDDNCALFFYNPFNRHTDPIIDLNLSCNHRYTSVHFFHPPTSPECFIVGAVSPLYLDEVIVDILKCDGDGWKSVTYDSGYEFLFSNAAPVLHRGLVYFVGMGGDVATLDIDHGVWTAYPESLEFQDFRSQIRRHFLLKINGDALYAVFMIDESEKVNVFRLLEPEMKWERVRDLGDKRLYLSLASSFGDVAKPEAMANTICFPVFEPNGTGLLFYSLETQKYHSFDGKCSFDSSVGLEKLHYGVTWITPVNPHQLSAKLAWCLDSENGECDS